MEIMRVGVLTTSYPRTADDFAGNFVAGLATWLAQRAEVEVLSASERWPIFYRGGAPSALRGLGWAWGALYSARLWRCAAVAARRWDAIVSHWTIPCGLIAARLARGRPHVAIAHGSD